MSNNLPLEHRNINWPFAMLSIILVVLSFFLVANWVGGSLMYLVLGKMPSEADFLNPGDQAVLLKKTLLIGQIGGTVIGMVLLPLLYTLFLKKELLATIFSPSKTQFSQFLLIAIAITFIVMPFIGIVGDWNKNMKLPEIWNAMESSLRNMEEKAAQMTKLIVYYNSISELFLILFTIALLPAIAEELVFRGILQNELIKTIGNVHVAIFISSAVFSFIHFQFFGFFPRMLLGMVLGYLYFTSGNILISMTMHFMNNAMVVIALNLHQKGILGIDPESSKDIPIESIILSIILSSALLYLCWRLYKQRMEGTKPNV